MWELFPVAEEKDYRSFRKDILRAFAIAGAAIAAYAVGFALFLRSP